VKILIVSLVAYLIACGSKSSEDKSRSDEKIASCNMPKLGTCREYNSNNLALGSGSLAKLCGTGTTGTFAMIACPTDKLVGSCAKPESKDYFYEGYIGDAARLEGDCKSAGGTFAKR
jgi:hypothetical protein